jgi:hypothetical protein
MPEKIEDWKAPWEVKGEDIDPDATKTLLFNLLTEQQKDRTQIADLKKSVRDVTEERDGLKDAASAAGDPTELQAENAELKKQIRAKDSELAKRADYDDVARERDRYDVALETGLTKTLAKRLVGADRDEILADAQALREDLGLTDGNGAGGDGGADGGGQSGDVTGRIRTLREQKVRLGDGSGNSGSPSLSQKESLDTVSEVLAGI